MNKLLLVELESFIKNNDLLFPLSTLDEIYAISWKTKLNLTCKNCGEKFDISVKQLLRPHPERSGKVCPRCNAEDLFLKKLNELYGKNPYTFLSKFRGYQEPLKVKCNDCGTEWESICARNLLMKVENHPCRQCASNRNFKKDISTFQEKLKDKFGECNYIFLNPEKFTGIYSKQKIDVKCKFCESEFSVHPQNLLSPRNGKHYCKNCNTKKFKREL